MESEATGSRKVTRSELFSVLKSEHFFKFSSSRCIDRLVEYIQDLYKNKNLSVGIEKQLQDVLKVLVSQLFAKWRASKSMYDRFSKKESKWLAAEIKLPEIFANTIPRALANVPDASEPQRPSTYTKFGRPEKLFEASSKRTRERKVLSIVSQNTPEKLCSAAETSLIKSGKRIAAQVLNMASTATPKRLKKMRKAYLSPSPSLVPYTSDEALGLMVDLGLTKEQYIQMRLGAKKRGADIYPSYHNIMEAKNKCYPPNIRITESVAVVPVQDLVDQTVHRLVQVQSQVILENTDRNIDTLDMYYKWGLDGSGGHSIYKQNFADNSMYADSNIILCTMVPLELSETKEKQKKIYWKNYSTSSTRFCRPLSFKLKRENDKNTKEEYDEIDLQIEQLRPTMVILGERTIHVKHNFICTMVDGKTVNVLTDTKSTQACNVCKATPVSLNNIEDLQKRECNQDTFKFGLSVLHSYLRTYEYLLHIAYKLDIKQWQARGKEVKDRVKLRKKDICNKFYSKMGLVVDQPKQGGGNSNDGNTARKFFKNPKLVAEITGLSEDLIERYSNILTTLSSGHYINEEKFKAYAIETAKLTVSLYGWYKMSASVHKILVHGADIIKSMPLPVGQLSEDVLEASQKSHKTLRQFHSRKISRLYTNTDIFNWMLISSDPVITNTRKSLKNEASTHNETVRGMLRMPLFLASDDTVEYHDDDDLDDRFI